MRGLGILVEPIKVGFRTGHDGESDEFGDVVAVEAFHFPFQATQLSCGGFDEKQELAGFFYFAIPTIVGFDGAAENVDAGGQAFFDDAAGDEFCLHGIGAGD